ncbi:Uncharacterized conserved protein [Clostridium cavendishii DSM 21758]|uniref:Uncharacterized conserved protein n=1 Tax=Clostridium cavendishii DSM 21758 TaxID=1121302 RepID=A0A1M6AXP8_9CLOT|nr:6-hydroxymethylpterin diphosphokinase MptE-like protein [Clostridium cavendishii]SHI41191.1 Uncharacterized conserved protein [Clostridium cavendishii DSM 21758]
MIEVEKIKNGLYTLKCNGKYIHSKYDPIKEGNIFAENVDKLSKYILIYGLGLGYHINSILESTNESSQVIVFEANNTIIDYCKKYNEDIFLNKRVKVIGFDKEFYKLLEYYLNKVDNIVVHKPSLEGIKEENKKLYSLINEYEIIKESIKKNYDLLLENYNSNLKESYFKIRDFILEKKADKPYLIVAAGPSLDGEIELIKKHKEKFNIITVGTAFKILMKNDIKPLAIVIIDGEEVVYKQIKGYENEKIPLCFLNTASRIAVSSYKGPKYMFYNSEENDDIIITTGKTVAVAAIDIAIKCGAKEIVMVGQDLAFINDKAHTKNYEEIYEVKDRTNEIFNNTYVTSIDGKELKTTKGYLYFKEKIQKIISCNNNIRFFNCSKGAKIEGAKHCSLDEYIMEK